MMAYVTAEARQELLETIAEAASELGTALASVGAAYEELDEQTADTLEEELFRPLQVALGRTKRTVTSFADRHRMSSPAMEARDAGPPSTGFKGHLADAEDNVRQAEAILTELQDSLSPVEVGDPELRAGLADVRERIAELPARAERFVSRFGR
jgi:chromosome segregation ATPase